MSALTGPRIEKLVRAGTLVIDPFHPDRVNPNSYNLTLAPVLRLPAMPSSSTRRWSSMACFVTSPSVIRPKPAMLRRKFSTSNIPWLSRMKLHTV